MTGALRLLVLLAVPLWSFSATSHASAEQQPSISASAAGSGGSVATRMGSTFKQDPVSIALRLRGLLGYGLILALGYALCRERRAIRWRSILWGLGLQALFALVVLNPLVGNFFFRTVDTGVRSLLSFAEAGMDFVFSATVPHQATFVDNGELVTQVFIGHISPVMKTFAFWILPTVIFFSSLITVLYHLGVMQWIVKGMARGMAFMMKTSGAETLSCTANIFVGQTEAPLLVKPFIKTMTTSELMAVMTGGFATVAGGVLAIYVMMLQQIPGIAGHLVTASIMAAPCALAMSKLMLPETAVPRTGGAVEIEVERPDSNVIEAAARGASEGMTLVLNIAAMLMAFVALMTMINAVVGLFGFNVQQLLGWILSPLAWCMGIPWDEATLVGQFMGEKFVLTELIAYKHLQASVASGQALLGQRTAVMASYALCGFANVASIGIQIGGIGGIAPERRGELARLGLRAMFAGALVSCLSGILAGLIV